MAVQYEHVRNLKVGEGKRQVVKKKDPHGKYEWILCLAQIVG